MADLLETSVAATNSALQRARATLKQRFPDGRDDAAVAPAVGEREQALLARYLQAWDETDIDALVALLKEDAALLISMPPSPTWYRGPSAIAEYIQATCFDPSLGIQLRLEPTKVNRQPAFAVYRRDSRDEPYRLTAIMVLTLEDGQIAQITGFQERALFPFFGFPTEYRL